MKIKELTILSDKLDEEKIFYSKILGFDLCEEFNDVFTVKIGWSKLTFKRSNTNYKYHYCFLIPSNKLFEALDWMEKRVEILDIENGRRIQYFESWNANSFYFHDASGNVAEFIVRHDLNNNINTSFSIKNVICLNEIGLPTTSIEITNSILEKELNSYFWKGNKTTFGTNGTQEGLFLLPNYRSRTKWFPTELAIKPCPFKALIENSNEMYEFEFSNETIKIKMK